MASSVSALVVSLSRRRPDRPREGNRVHWAWAGAFDAAGRCSGPETAVARLVVRHRPGGSTDLRGRLVLEAVSCNRKTALDEDK